MYKLAKEAVMYAALVCCTFFLHYILRLDP